MICNNCHGLVHKAALSILSKKPKGTEFFPADQIDRARPIVMQIVKATQESRDNPNLDNPTTLMIKIPKRTLKLLHLLKVDANFTNLEQFVKAIIMQYVRSKF